MKNVLPSLLDDFVKAIKNLCSLSCFEDLSGAGWEECKVTTDASIKSVFSHASSLCNNNWDAVFLKDLLEVAINKALVLEMETRFSINSLSKIVDVAIICLELGYFKERVLPPHAMLTQVVDMLTVKDFEALLEYVESRITRLFPKDIPRSTLNTPHGTYLVKFANELLRRLSKAERTVFCGKVLIFLAKAFPLSERSATNNLGKFNLENITKIEDDYKLERSAVEATQKENTPAASSAPVPATNVKSEAEVEEQFYKRFWKLQDFCRDPHLVIEPPNLEEFRQMVEAIMAKFVDLNTKDTLQRSLKPDSKKRPRSMVEEEETSFFAAKYLTAKNLFPLQLRDPSFRKQILTQILIVLSYLCSFSEEGKEKLLKANAQRTLIHDFILPKEHFDWMMDKRKETYKLMNNMFPNGSQFMQTVKVVMRHDGHWTDWKNQRCPDIQLPSYPIPADEERIKCLEEELNPLYRPFEIPVVTLDHLKEPSTIQLQRTRLEPDFDEHLNNYMDCWTRPEVGEGVHSIEELLETEMTPSKERTTKGKEHLIKNKNTALYKIARNKLGLDEQKYFDVHTWRMLRLTFLDHSQLMNMATISHGDIWYLKSLKTISKSLAEKLKALEKNASSSNTSNTADAEVKEQDKTANTTDAIALVIGTDGAPMESEISSVAPPEESPVTTSTTVDMMKIDEGGNKNVVGMEVD